MRALKAFALAVAIAIALIAGTVDLRDPPKLLPQRAAPSPIIIVGLTIEVEASSLMPLLIEVGPPEWVPRDSTLDIQGLPSGVALSQGRRLSEDLWAVPVGDLANLRIEAAATTWVQSDLTLTLVAEDGSVLAKASTRISINAPTLAAVDPSATSSPFKQRSEVAYLRPPPVEVAPAIGVPGATREPLPNGALPSASEGPSPAPATAEEPGRNSAIASSGGIPRETPTESPEPKPSVAPSAADRVGEVEGLSGVAPVHVRMASFEVTAIGAPAKQEPSRSGAVSAVDEGLGLAPATQERKSAIALSGAALVTPAYAQRCMIAGGWGTGVFESFAGFMAESAMKDSVKAKLGDEARIGAVNKRCERKGLLVECTARVRGCR